MGKRKKSKINDSDDDIGEDLDATYSDDELDEDVDEEDDYLNEEIYPPDEVLFLGKQSKIVKKYYDVEIYETTYKDIPEDEDNVIEIIKVRRKWKLLKIVNTFSRLVGDLQPKIKTKASLIHMQGTKLIKALETCKALTENKKVKKNCEKIVDELQQQIDAPHMLDREQFDSTCEIVKKYLKENLTEKGLRLHVHDL